MTSTVGASLAALTAGVALSFLGAGCQVSTTALRVKGEPSVTQDLSVNSEQMRLRTRSAVPPLCGLLVAAADRIVAETTNRAVHREALVWKIDAVPALREALFRPDAYTAIFDAWVLSVQMTDYFEKGRGRELLGESAAVAATSCRELEAEIGRIAATMTHSGDLSAVQQFARKWAGENPIRHTIAGRESVLNRATEREIAVSFSTTEVMGNVAVTMDDLNRRIEIYSAQLPEQARWQAELFALDSARLYGWDRVLPLAGEAADAAAEALESMQPVLPRLEAALSAIESVPSLASSERVAAIAAIQTEVARAIQAIHEERLAVLEYVTLERQAALTSFQTSLLQERQGLSHDLELAALKVVDHAFGRLLPFAAGAVALFLAAGFLRRRTTANRPPA